MRKNEAPDPNTVKDRKAKANKKLRPALNAISNKEKLDNEKTIKKRTNPDNTGAGTVKVPTGGPTKTAPKKDGGAATANPNQTNKDGASPKK